MDTLQVATDPIARTATPSFPSRAQRQGGKVLFASDLSDDLGAVEFTCRRLLKDGDTLLLYHTLIPITHTFDDGTDRTLFAP